MVGIIGSLIEPVCEKFVSQIHTLQENHAMATVEHVAEYLARMVEGIEESAVFNCRYFDAVMDVFAHAVANVTDPAANKQILLFFTYVVGVRNEKYKDKIDLCLTLIMVATIQTLASATTLSTEVAILIGGIFERNEAIAKSAIQIAISQPKFSTVPEYVKGIFVNFVSRFHAAIPRVKAIVVELNKLMQSMSTKDAFLGFELQLAQQAGKTSEQQASKGLIP